MLSSLDVTVEFLFCWKFVERLLLKLIFQLLIFPYLTPAKSKNFSSFYVRVYPTWYKIYENVYVGILLTRKIHLSIDKLDFGKSRKFSSKFKRKECYKFVNFQPSIDIRAREKISTKLRKQFSIIYRRLVRSSRLTLEKFH